MFEFVLNFIHLDLVVDYAAYIAVIAYAVSGAIIAVQRDFDVFGVLFISVINTISGGVIRDVLANDVPVFLQDPIYLYLILFSVAIVLILKLYKFNFAEDSKVYIICDALGLASFSIIGGMIAIKKDLNLISILSFSLITAIGGSIVRDILLNKIPAMFSADFYASIALILGLCLFGLSYFSVLNSFSVTLLLFFGVGLRLIAYARKWKLPVVRKL